MRSIRRSATGTDDENLTLKTNREASLAMCCLTEKPRPMSKVKRWWLAERKTDEAILLEQPGLQ